MTLFTQNMSGIVVHNIYESYVTPAVQIKVPPSKREKLIFLIFFYFL